MKTIPSSMASGAEPARVPRGVDVSSLRWAAGLFCAAIGMVMLVEPYQFASPAYAALRPYLIELGAIMALAGAGLTLTVLLAPGRQFVILTHLLAGAAQLILAYTVVASGAWSEAPNGLIFGLGIMAAPFLARSHRPSEQGGEPDLFVVLLGLASIATGAFLVAVPGQFNSPVYELARPYFAAFGVVFVASGAVLVSVQALRPRSKLVVVLAHLIVAAALFAFLFAVVLPGRAWTGLVYYGGYGVVVLLLPWAGAHLRRMDGMSLRGRLALSLAAAAALPLATLLPFYAGNEESHAVTEALDHQQTLAAALAQDVSDYIVLHQAAARVLADRVSTGALSPQQQRDWLRASTAAYPDLLSAATFSANGDGIARADDQPQVPVTGYPVFERARASGLPSLDVLISPIYHRPVFSFGAPIYDRDGQFAGILAEALESSRLEALLTRTSTSNESRIYLVDASGRAIAHPDPTVEANLSDLSGQSPVAAFLKSPNSPGSLQTSPEADSVLAAYAPVPALGWGVIVERPTSVAMAATRTKLDRALLALMLAIAAASALGFFAAKRLTATLAALGKAVTSMASGNTGAPLPSSAVTELRDVVAAFSTMRDELTSRTDELRRLSLVASHTDSAVAIVDRHGTIDWVNAAFTSMCGYAAHELVGRKPGHVLQGPGTDGETAARIRTAVRAGQGFQEELLNYREDGSPYWVALNISPILDDDGICVGFVGIERDVTEHHQAEEVTGRLAAIVQSSEDAIIGRTLDGTISSWNAAAEQLYGYTRAEAIGQSIQLINPADRSDEVRSNLERVARGDKVEAHETIHRCKDGTLISVWLSVSPIRNARGNIIGAASIGRDITVRRRMEDALRVSEENNRRLIELSPDGIAVRQDGRFVYANPAALQLFGAVEPEQVVGRNTLDFVHLEDRPSSGADYAAVTGAIAHGLTIDRTPHERRCLRVDGTDFLAESAVAQVFHNGRPAILSVFRDVTERRRTKHNLRQQAALLDLAPVGIIARDMEGRVTLWNAGAQQLYGWSPEEAFGQVTHDLLQTVFPKSPEDVITALLGDGNWAGELRHRSRTGEQVIVASRQAVLRDDTGTPTAVLEVNSDVTARSRAEAALRGSEECFRLLMEGVTDYAILLLSPDGRVSSWNLGAERLFGYAADEILGEHVSRFHPVENLERRWPEQALARAEIDGSENDIGLRVRRDGSQFWADVVITALRDDRGRLRGFAKVTRDISTWKDAEEAQRRHAEYQDAIIQVQADIARAELNPGALVGLVAERVQRLTGATSAVVEFVDDRPIAYASAADSATPQDGFRLGLGGRLSALSAQTGEVLLCADTDVDPRVDADACRRAGVRSMIVAPLKAGQRTIGVLKVVSDQPRAFENQHRGTLQLVTGFLGAALVHAHAFAERLRAETAAQVAAQRFRSVLRAATECSIVGTDLNGTITVFNQGAERMLGYSADELIGETTIARLHDPGELAQRTAELGAANPHEALFASALRGEAETREWAYIRRDGSRIPVSLTVTGMRGEDGLLVGFIGIATDIAERKAVDQMKDQFVSMVSHELRTPMNGAIAMAELLLGTDLDTDQREFAETIRDSGRTLVAIVNDILDLARLQSGQVELEEIELDIRGIVEHVTELLITPARRKGVEFVGIVDRAVPYLLYGDPRRLRQVLTNLVANAIKFTDRGQVEVRLSVASETPNDVLLHGEVVDTGIGIPEDRIDRLFEPFTQADSSVTRRYGGTGLGLAICKQLVQALGGEIGASSQTGSGSTFWFTARFKKPAVEAHSPVPRSVQDLRVLVVEPHPLRCAALCEQLAAWGVGVDVYGQALNMDVAESSAQSQPDIVLVSTTSSADAEMIARSLDAGDTRVPPVIWLNASGRPTHSTDRIWATLLWPFRQSQFFDLLAQIADRKADGVERLAPPTRRSPGAAPSISIRADAPLVLVVDDVEVNRRVAEHILLRLGYRSQTAESGQAALDALARTTFAAVLMDCRMPDMDGFEATAEIRRHEGDARHTPIIALTADAQKSDREYCLSKGMDDYISKPVEMVVLARLLANWVPDASSMGSAGDPGVGSGLRVLDPDALNQIKEFDEPGETIILAKLAATFRVSSEGYMARLKGALEVGDHEKVRDTAHALRGAAAALGAEQVRFLAQELELRGRQQSPAGADEQLAALVTAREQALAALTREVARQA